MTNTEQRIIFVKAHIEGFIEGFLSGVSREEYPIGLDHSDWFDSAFSQGYNEGTNYKFARGEFSKEDFEAGFLHGWNLGYCYAPLDEDKKLDNRSESYLIGFDVGMTDGINEGFVQERIDEMQ